VCYHTGMNEQRIEPGLLKVFRLSVGIQWVLVVLAICGELLDEQLDPQFMTLFALVHTTLLMGILSWKRISMILGRFFLPLTLLLASVGPIAGFALATAARIGQGMTGDAAWVGQDGLIVWLLVPLLLVSSQYSLRVMFAFCFGTALLEVALSAILDVLGGPRLAMIVEEILIRLMLFVVVGSVVVSLSRAQRLQREALAQKNAQLSHYAATLEQLAVSRERNRMARELHDTLAHTLSAGSVQLEALSVLLDSDLDAARRQLQSTQAMMRSGLQEARRALRALRASPLDDLGLLLALRQLAESTAERAGLELALQFPEQIESLPPEIEQHVYRIAEEALTNVVRHSNARRLSVCLRPYDGRIKLTIHDDGIGFDPAQAKNGGQFGLMGMQERALLCGGILRVESQPQQGTTIIFEGAL